jgi:hypothetical protein
VASSSEDESWNTIIAEIPAPHCVKEESPFLEDIRSARAKFDAKLTATGTFQTVKIPVRHAHF